MHDSERRGWCNLHGECAVNFDFSQCLDSGNLQSGKIGKLDVLFQFDLNQISFSNMSTKIRQSLLQYFQMI